MNQCTRQQAELYRKWEIEGHLTLTDGAVIDQDQITDEVKEWLAGDNLQEIGVDPWNTTQWSLNMAADGYPIVEVMQSTKNLSEAMKETEAMIYSDRVHQTEIQLWNG